VHRTQCSRSERRGGNAWEHSAVWGRRDRYVTAPSCPPTVLSARRASGSTPFAAMLATMLRGAAASAAAGSYYSTRTLRSAHRLPRGRLRGSTGGVVCVWCRPWMRRRALLELGLLPGVIAVVCWAVEAWHCRCPGGFHDS
jgi:hypothetical protein